MAESLASSAANNIKIDSAQAVVEWTVTGGQKRYLYQRDQGPLPQTTFDITFDAAAAAAIFKLKVPVGLKSMLKNRTPLFLHIHGGRISSLLHDVVDTAPETVAQKLGAAPNRLKFSLIQPPDVVAPPLSLAPQDKTQGGMIDDLKLLGQETRFDVYFTHPSASGALLKRLCEAVAGGRLGSLDSSAVLRGLYKGEGGRALRGAALQISVSHQHMRKPGPVHHLVIIDARHVFHCR